MNINLNFNSIKIIDIRYLRTNNIWNYDNTIQILIDTGDFKNILTNQINGFSDNLINQIPSLITHRCGTGEIGGFITRVKEGITIAHLLEHVIIELSFFALNWKGIGKTRSTDKDGYFYIAIYCGIIYENVMRECIECSLEILENVLNGKKILLCNYKNRIFSKYDHFNYNKFIYLFLNNTKLPFIFKNEYDYIQIGYGINQHRILNGFFDSANSISNSILTNEDYYKSILEEFNIKTTKSYISNSSDECVNIFYKINSPVIIKPLYKKKSLCGIKKNITNKNVLFTEYLYSISHNLDNSKSVIIQKFYNLDTYTSVVINGKIICTYKLDFVEKNIEIIGNNTNTIIELVNDNCTQSLLANSDMDKLYIENDMLCDYDYLFEYISKNNIDINHVLKNTHKINIKKKYAYPIEIHNISKKIKKKILLPSEILNLKYYEIKYFIENNSIESEENSNIIVQYIRQNLNVCLASSCYNYYSRIFGEFFNHNNNYNIPIIGIIGSGNRSYVNKVISNFFIYIGKYTCSCDEFNYYINGVNTNLNNKTKWENIELALVNNLTEVLVFSIDTSDYISEGIYCKHYNPVILGNVNTDYDEYYYTTNYKPNTYKLLASFLESYNKNGFIVLNGDDTNIFDFINYCKSKKFITKPKFIFYTTKHFKDILNNGELILNSDSNTNLDLDSQSFVYIENNIIYLKNYLGIKELIQIPIGSNPIQLLSVIASIWSVYDIYSDDKKNMFVDFYKTKFINQLFL
jgi:cyanophycin synthetase